MNIKITDKKIVKRKNSNKKQILKLLKNLNYNSENEKPVNNFDIELQDFKYEFSY